MERFSTCKYFAGLANHFSRLPRETSLNMFLVLEEDQRLVTSQTSFVSVPCSCAFANLCLALAVMVTMRNLIAFTVPIY
jgi:hypothetical protein